jgi:hypothetical protein
MQLENYTGMDIQKEEAIKIVDEASKHFAIDSDTVISLKFNIRNDYEISSNKEKHILVLCENDFLGIIF